MCDDNEDCGNGMAHLMAKLHGPGVARECDRFLAHMRDVIPDFAQEVNRELLLIVFSAGRSAMLAYLHRQNDTLSEAANAITAIMLADYATERGLDVEQLSANLDRSQQRDKQPQEATQ